jgi:hypothetical protein
VTYIHIAGSGVYVRESPDEVFALREAAMEGEEARVTSTLKAVE